MGRAMGKRVIGQRMMHVELLISDARDVKRVKNALEARGAFVKPVYAEGPVKVVRTQLDAEGAAALFPGMPVREWSATEERSARRTQDIVEFSLRYFRRHMRDDVDEEVAATVLAALAARIPTKYSVYPPVLLFNNSAERSFTRGEFTNGLKLLGISTAEYFAALLGEFLGASRDRLPMRVVAVNRPIEEADTLRQPHHLDILYRGDNGSDDDLWCELRQNGLWQSWNPTRTMFSRGNVKEKARVLDPRAFPDVRANDVVDLYCGIGYFTFSYLARGCRHLFGFELNPWSVAGLWRGHERNGADPEHARTHIYNEDNEASVERLGQFREAQMQGGLLRIRHINLGLLPSSKQGWPVALSLLREHHDWAACPLATLHVHENVGAGELEDGTFVQGLVEQLAEIEGAWTYAAVHVERIKTFAPGVWHVCVDVDVRSAA